MAEESIESKSNILGDIVEKGLDGQAAAHSPIENVTDEPMGEASVVVPKSYVLGDIVEKSSDEGGAASMDVVVEEESVGAFPKATRIDEKVQSMSSIITGIVFLTLVSSYS